MPEIEAILVLLVAVAALATLAARIGVPYPILLVLGGLVLGFVPALPRVELDPEVVFLLFLPPLLYVSALFTSWRDFRANLRPISLLAVGLVLMTTCAVAAVAHWGGRPPLGGSLHPRRHRLPYGRHRRHRHRPAPRCPAAHSDDPRR